MKLHNAMLVVVGFLMLMLEIQVEGITFNFPSFKNPISPSLTLQGDAHVPLETKFLRLIKTSNSGVPGNYSAGRVLYATPLKLTENTSFDTTITFSILPSSYSAADGFAFFLAPVGSTIGNAAGNLAIYDSDGIAASTFAVEFDTFSNPWDPNGHHIGINFYSRISYNTTSFDSATGEKITARITYQAATGAITVVASSCKSAATVSYVFKLSSILPDRVQIGLSGATGSPANNIGVPDVYSWSFSSTNTGKFESYLSM